MSRCDLSDDIGQSEDSPEQVLTASTWLRKKGTGIRAWMVVDTMGKAHVVEAGKHAIMRRTGLPARDLRILDPILSYPSTILGRERAIVINLEHVKAIITAHEVLLLNLRDPSVTPFIEELQRCLLSHHHASKHQEGNGDGSNGKNLYELDIPHESRVSENRDESSKVEGKRDIENQDGSAVLPFEFVALEACLEAACSCLETEARTLDQEANSALDKLTSTISTLNLDRVRHIKSRLVAITGRVQKVRDELENLLDDEEDMAEMYLTEKLVHQNLEDSSDSSMNEIDEMVDEASQSDMHDRMMPPEISLQTGGCSNVYKGGHNPDNPGGNRTSTSHSGGNKNLDVKELEMVLESYFVQIDGTLNKLTTLREYVDDTEDYINIMLDDKQNHLLQMGVMLSTATLVLSSFVVVAGIMGMNIRIELFEDQVLGPKKFMWTIGGSTAGSIFLYVFAIALYKRKRLLEW
ncbi:magnesium transporter MRS2-3-like [Juglans regia]|uniref:Magnesium transporter n=1 Tax=Juglans regia TaxID=51240 RepID=A0A6P9E6P6_JUGRE|nr:magnesium transporter MRS2-3-like [Juglans regia]